VSCRGALAAALLVALAAPAAAHAQASGGTELCFAKGYTCTSVPVPLDRTGALPGTIGLGVIRHQLGAAPTRSAVVAIAGGPGQASTPFVDSWIDALKPALASRDLLLFDQRGTGRSMPLVCDSLRSSKLSAVAKARACSAGLGRLRGSYRTADSVADLEALRVWGGYDKLFLHGVSYGTRLALDYASAYPQHVEALVLDSVVPQVGEDPFDRATIAAIGPMLDDLCRSACQRFTKSIDADYTTLVHRIRAGRVRAPVYDDGGRRHLVTVAQRDLLNVLGIGDLDSGTRSSSAGLIAAAVHGDPQPLVRFAAAFGRDPSTSRALVENDEPLLLATACEEQPMPWARDVTSVDARRAAIAAAAAAVPAAEVAPFSAAGTVSAGYAPYCLGWPALSAAPAPPAPLPDVPTLVLEGRGDLRTPVEQARRVVAGIPHAQVVVVPRYGHSVLGSEDTGCASDALEAFVAGKPVAPCTKASSYSSPIPPPPARLADVTPASGAHGRAARTLAAVRLTLLDAAQYALAGVGGLRGGSARFDFNDYSLRLKRDSYVPGVWISGTIVRSPGFSKIVVGGPAAVHGTLRISPGGKVTGRLGGQRVKLDLTDTARALKASAARARTLR